MCDTILCKNKREAMKIADGIGWNYIEDWLFLNDGKVRLLLNCTLKEVKDVKKEIKRRRCK